MKRGHILPFFLLGGLTVFFCWFFVGRYGIFGSKVDWISQHSVIPDYLRQQFYETGELFPEFAANMGGGQNIYHFSYYGLFNPVILISYLLPFVKMGDYIMGASVACLGLSVALFYGWLLERGFSERISFTAALMYLLAGPMIFHSYCQIMFVNYMPFLCLAFLGVDRYFDRGGRMLYTISVFLMILTSFYFSIGGMLALTLYGLYRYLERKGRATGPGHDALLDKGGHRAGSRIGIRLTYFLWDGIRFLWPMLVAVLLGGILLIPTAAALMGRDETKAAVSLASLLIPNIQTGRLIYTPYGMGLPSLMITVLIAGFTYKRPEERALSWGCGAILTIPFFAWALNGGLYVRDKGLIPFLPLLCYLIALYFKKMERREISFAAGAIPFLATIALLAPGQAAGEFSRYGALFLTDAALMAGCFLMFWRKKRLEILMVPPVVFLVLFGTVFHQRTGWIQDRNFYEKATDPAIGQAVGGILDSDKGFYRLEQLGSPSENTVNMNRTWNRGQYISSIYSSSYNREYQRFRRDTFDVDEPLRNELMQPVSQNPLFLQLMGVRYLISEEEIPGYTFVRKTGNLRIYKNEAAAPVAYVTDRIISKKAYEELDFPYNQMALAYGAVGPEENGKVDGKHRKALERQILDEVRQGLSPAEILLPEQKMGTLKITKTRKGYHIRAEEKGTVQVEFPETEDRAWKERDQILLCQFRVKNNHPSQDITVRINGEGNKLTAKNHFYYNGNTTFTFGAVLEKGKQEAELSLGKGDYEITDLTCFLGDWKELTDQEGRRRLYQSEFRLDKERTGGNVIAGDVDAKKEGYFITSIPYDPNFEILVDGKIMKAEKVNTAFLGFPIGRGRHDINLTYHAPGRKAGAWCSGVGAVLLLLLAVGRPSRKNPFDR